MTPAQIINAVMALIVMLVVFAAGYAGYSVRGAQCGEQLAKIEAAAAEREKATALRVIEEQQRIQRENEAIETAYIHAKTQQEARHARIKPKLSAAMPAHQRADGACNLNRGTVGLLNDTARSHEPGTEAAALAITAPAAPSTVTESALVEHCRSWAEQYERTAGQLNALIVWHATVPNYGINPDGAAQ